jgi:tryptophan synthase alpha chain
VAVGFGIKTPDRAAAVARIADGVVVGSVLVDVIGAAIAMNQSVAPKVLESAASLAKAVHSARVEQPVVQA